MLKIIKLSNLALKTFRANNDKFVRSDDNRANKIINLSKNLAYMPNIEAIKKPIFLTLNTKKTFNNLKQAFIKALIF